MRSSTFLRIASILTLFYFAGHTAGAPWTPDESAGGAAVVAAMKGHSFDVLGSARTYWDFYFGFGIIISLFLLLLAVVLWQLASLAKTDAARVRPIIAVFLLAFIVNTVLAWEYFFIIPLVNSAAISVCLAIAFAIASRSKVTQ